ncbi:MAG: VOC family protein [Acidimicrobiales bacterium]|nr:VOC family protein [Acidimicrobiales bacterium]
MRTSHDVFHLAIPAFDLDQAEQFYVDGLGCKLARRYPDRITLDFFGDQVVCHLSEQESAGGQPAPQPASLYPRHFGVTFRHLEEFEAVHRLAKARKLPFFNELGRRFTGLVEEHQTFVLVDPSGNLIEFKHYDDPRMMY